MGHAATMWKMRNAYRIVTRCLKTRQYWKTS